MYWSSWGLISIVKTMVLRKAYIDFITIDGAEGGTGAAPAEFTDHLDHHSKTL